jgi:hypothetical protein
MFKALVGVVLVLESLVLSCCCHYIYYYLIQHYGQPQHIVRTVWSVWLSDEIGFVIAWLVNMFFVRRIYVLSNRKLWLAVLIGALATIRPGFGFAATTFAYSDPLWTVFHARVQWMFISGLSVGISTDFLIAFAISYYLVKGRDTNIASTRNIVNLLLRYTINSTVILAFFAALEMIFLLSEPHTLVFLGLFQIQIQLYANCFLATLNARQSLQQNITSVSNVTPLSTLRASTRQNVSHITTADMGIKTDAFNIQSTGDVNISTEKVNPE